MNLHCPCCHAQFSIENIAQDEAARELLALRPTMLPSLLPYLTLFRTEKRSLPFDRALKLSKEVMTLPVANPAQMETALAETVEAMRRNREAGAGKPLKNHNYLKRVLESIPVTPPPSGHLPLDKGRPGGVRTSRRQEAMAALLEWAGQDWLRTAIAEGLQALIALSLENTPAADTITATADIWHLVLTKSRLDIEEIDQPRIVNAFTLLLAKRLGKWPEPKDLKELLPPRPQRTALRHDISEADRQLGRDAIRKLSEQLGG